MLAWLHFQERPSRATYGVALVLFAAGVLAKNMVVTLPAALLILQWYRSGRLTTRDLRLVAPFVAIAVGFAAFDLTVVSAATPADFHYSIVERVMIAGRAVWFYASTLLWPADLVVIYPHWDVEIASPLAWEGATAATAWLGVAAVPLTAAALWVVRGRTGRGPLAGFLFFCVTLSPALGFIDHTYMLFSFVADRYQYLASIGLTAVLVGVAAQAATRGPPAARRAAMALAAAVLVLLGTLTWQQSSIYSDQLTFFEAITERNPTAVGAHLNLANALRDAGRLEEAQAAGRGSRRGRAAPGQLRRVREPRAAPYRRRRPRGGPRSGPRNSGAIPRRGTRQWTLRARARARRSHGRCRGRVRARH